MKQFNLRSTFEGYAPSLLSGLLLGLSYPSYPYVHLEFLAWVWMVPLLLSLKQVQSLPRFLCRVYLSTLVTCVVGMHWLTASTVKGSLILFFLGALVFSIPFVGFFFMRRVFGWRAALCSAPVLWTAWEWLYQQSEGSIGWLSMGVTQSNLYWLVQYIDITGVWGITFWLVLLNVLIVMAVEEWLTERSRNDESRRATRLLTRRLAIVSGLMIVVPLAYGAYIFTKAELGPQSESRGESRRESKELSVLLVQPNVNPWEKLAENSHRAVLRKTIALTNSALAGAEPKPDLIVWPETAVPYVLADDKDAREFLFRAVTRWQTPLLTGLLDAKDEGDQKEHAADQAARVVFNSAVLLSPGVPSVVAAGKRLNVESSSVYHKRVLMPFVERVPFVDRFPWLQRLAINIGAGDGVEPGREATIFSLRTRGGAEVKVATAICYESLYPAKVAELVRNGAQLLTLITNEGWFSQTHGEYQIAAFSRLRSIETRRATARAANTGVTWLVDRYGRVREQAPWWSEQALAGRVALSDELSVYVRYPDYFPRACAWLSLIFLLAVVMEEMHLAFRHFRRLRPADDGRLVEGNCS
jgi:apolipoprotein N-acyltransferase